MTKSKFAATSDSSSNEDDSSSHSLTSSEEDDDDDESGKGNSLDHTYEEEDSKPSTKLDDSSLTGLSSVHEQNSEVLDDLFPGI